MLAAMTRCRGAEVVQERSDIASKAAENRRKRASYGCGERIRRLS
jgi:hypothetical protein